jgi:hypothetical protein
LSRAGCLECLTTMASRNEYCHVLAVWRVINDDVIEERMKGDVESWRCVQDH